MQMPFIHVELMYSQSGDATFSRMDWADLCWIQILLKSPQTVKASIFPINIMIIINWAAFLSRKASNLLDRRHQPLLNNNQITCHTAPSLVSTQSRQDDTVKRKMRTLLDVWL